MDASQIKTKTGGKIINLSSVREVRGYTGGNAAYCATKGAVGMITKTLALELAPHNISKNTFYEILTKGFPLSAPFYSDDVTPSKREFVGDFPRICENP